MKWPSLTAKKGKIYKEKKFGRIDSWRLSRDLYFNKNMLYKFGILGPKIFDSFC